MRYDGSVEGNFAAKLDVSLFLEEGLSKDELIAQGTALAEKLEEAIRQVSDKESFTAEVSVDKLTLLWYNENIHIEGCNPNHNYKYGSPLQVEGSPLIDKQYQVASRTLMIV